MLSQCVLEFGQHIHIGTAAMVRNNTPQSAIVFASHVRLNTGFRETQIPLTLLPCHQLRAATPHNRKQSICNQTFTLDCGQYRSGIYCSSKTLLQYYSVLQSTTPVLLRTTEYYKVLLQYYCSLRLCNRYIRSHDCLYVYSIILSWIHVTYRTYMFELKQVYDQQAFFIRGVMPHAIVMATCTLLFIEPNDNKTTSLFQCCLQGRFYVGNDVSYVTRIKPASHSVRQAQYLVKVKCHFSW